jgi:hypothetical protein
MKEILAVIEKLISNNVYFHCEHKPLRGGKFNFIFHESNIQKAQSLFSEKIQIKLDGKFNQKRT